MKFTLKLLSFSFIAALLFSACTDPDIVTKAEDTAFDTEGAIVNVTNVGPGFFDLGDLANAAVGYTLSTSGASVSGADVFLSRNGGDYQLLKTVSSFPSDEVTSLSDVVGLFGITTDDVSVGESYTFKFVANTADGTYETGKKFSVQATCTSALAGTYDFSTEDYFCDGDAVTGSVDLTEISAGLYTFSDWGFGSYEACYGGPAAGWGSLEIGDVCNKLTITGLDGYGDSWSWSDLVVDGANLTFTWVNTYGETGKTTLTNPNGDWPPLSL